MARGLNQAELIGRVGVDVEPRTTGNGTTVVNLRIATDESYKNNDGDLVEQTEWHSVVFFGKLADIVSEYVRKGDLIFVSGSLRTRKWEDREGNDRYTTEIRADRMLMLGSKSSNGKGGSAKKSSGNPKAQKQDEPAPVEADDDGYAPDDELPF